MNTQTLKFLSVIVLFTLTTCSQKPAAQQTTQTPVALPTYTYKIDEEDGQWQMPAKNYASTRFSGLTEINTSNVNNLKVAWTFSTGVVRGHEAAPLVVNNTMYVVTPYPNILYALDLTQNGAVKWKYEPKPAPAAQGVACCDVVNRGAAYSNGRIFYNTLDNLRAGSRHRSRRQHVAARCMEDRWLHCLGLDLLRPGTEPRNLRNGDSWTMEPDATSGRQQVDGKLVYVALSSTVIVGIEPEGVTISPDGRWVYVTAETSNTVSVIDTQSNDVVATFLVGARPRDSAFSPDGSRAYVTAELGRTLSVIDTQTHTVIRTIDLTHADGVKPMGVVVSNDGEKIYVANGRANSVSVIDARTDKVLATIPVGQRVWGLALTRDGRKLYAANGLSNDVSVIDTATNAVVTTVTAGDGPWGIAIVGL